MGEERQALFLAVNDFLGLVIGVALHCVGERDQRVAEVGEAGQVEVVGQVAQGIQRAIDAPLEAGPRLDEDARLGPAARKFDQRHGRGFAMAKAAQGKARGARK